MKVIETNGITHLEKLNHNEEWYWGTDYIIGDLYEAEEVYNSVYFIIFFDLHQCLVKLSELESISAKAKRDRGFPFSLQTTSEPLDFPSVFCYFNGRTQTRRPLP